MPDHKHYYAGYSYMGINYTYDSPCWKLYIFDSPQERDRWVAENEYSQDTGNYVAEALSARNARKMRPDLERVLEDLHMKRRYRHHDGVEHWYPVSGPMPEW